MKTGEPAGTVDVQVRAVFQSTPVSEDGRTASVLAIRAEGHGFNPRPSVKTGEPAGVYANDAYIQFQSTPVSEDGRTRSIPRSEVSIPVSIHARQ